MIIAAQSEDPRRNDPDFLAMPHVLLVVDQLPKALGGGERVALKLAALLPEHGYRASILSLSIHAQSAALRSAPCPIYALPLQSTYDLNAFKAALLLRRFLKQNRVQIVQTFFESSDLWAGCVTKLTSKAKLIWSRRDMGILRARKHSVAYRLLAGLPDAVFAVSEQVRLHSISVDGVNPDRVSTIYSGLNLSDWNQRPAKTSGDIVVTTVGNIRRVKGHDIFIRAAASLVSEFPRVRFTIAGDVLEPDYFVELQNLIQELNLSAQFHLIGSITNLKQHLSASDIFVLPSRSEGFSNAIIEAMAASLPVVATNVGGNFEAVIDGVSGFIVPSEDPVALSAAIRRLICNAPLAEAMGKAGRASVEENFTTRAMMNRTTQVYQTLLSQK